MRTPTTADTLLYFYYTIKPTKKATKTHQKPRPLMRIPLARIQLCIERKNGAVAIVPPRRLSFLIPNKGCILSVEHRRPLFKLNTPRVRFYFTSATDSRPDRHLGHVNFTRVCARRNRHVGRKLTTNLARVGFDKNVRRRAIV